jgi:uncharacterized membrane protein (UPF0127 family)
MRRKMIVNNSLFYFFSGHIAIRSLAITILLWACLAPSSMASGEIVELKVGQSAYQVELALTPAQRRQGLMYRQQLDSRQGMLLVYSRAGDHRIWMKNMRMALRVFWIDDEFTVISVQRLEPCSSSPCPVYSAPRAARFILELGDYEHALATGDKIKGLADL